MRLRLAHFFKKHHNLSSVFSVCSFHSSSLLPMPPKRKVESVEDSGATSKSRKMNDDDDTAAPNEVGKKQSTPESPSKPVKEKTAREKVTMSNYMPKEYAAGVYDDPNHLDGTCFKITTWNVNGLNACMDKGFRDYVRAENADILVLQETKLQEAKVPSFDNIIAELGYPHRYWSCSTAKKGYAGTALFSKVRPMRVTYGLGPSGALNEEGRTINAEFSNFHLVNCYVPNSGQKLERLQWRAETWDKEMLKHLKYLAVLAKPVVFTGDLNVAHEEIDLKNFKTNANKTAGFCDEERQGMTNFIAAGFEDTYRRLYPDGASYTYWGMRFNSYASNSGWRIDYFLASTALRPRIKDIITRSEVYGASDHCPLSLILEK